MPKRGSLKSKGETGGGSTELSGADDAGQHLSAAIRRFLLIRLARIEPGANCVDCDGGRELRRPVCPVVTGDQLGEVAAGHLHRVGAEAIHLGPELRLPGGMVEQKPESFGIIGSRGKQRLDDPVRRVQFVGEVRRGNWLPLEAQRRQAAGHGRDL